GGALDPLRALQALDALRPLGAGRARIALGAARALGAGRAEAAGAGRAGGALGAAWAGRAGRAGDPALDQLARGGLRVDLAVGFDLAEPRGELVDALDLLVEPLLGVARATRKQRDRPDGPAHAPILQNRGVAPGRAAGFLPRPGDSR